MADKPYEFEEPSDSDKELVDFVVDRKSTRLNSSHT